MCFLMLDLAMVFGKSTGYALNYGHCDLVWAKSAPQEIFPEIVKWLDQRQHVVASPQMVRQEITNNSGHNPYVRLKSPQTIELPLQIVVGEGRVKVR